MFRRVVFQIIALVVVFSMVSVAGERAPVEKDAQARFDRNRDGFLDEAEWETMHRFMEMSERARRLRAEAEDIEMALKREFGSTDRPGLKDRARAELAELREAAERAEREGRHDEAAELSKKAKILAQKMEAAERGVAEQKRAELKERHVQLVRMTQEAKERGEHDRAGELWAEAQEIAGILKRDAEKRPKAGPDDRVRAEVEELMRAAKRAEQEGRRDQAAELRERAEYLARRGKVALRGPEDRERAELEERLRDIEAQAREAEERGQKDRARELWAEAKGLRKALGRLGAQPAPGVKKGMPPGDDLVRQVEELRNEVRILRGEVARLRELVVFKGRQL
ncbi:MAG: hypothetical protein JSU94_09275 [Phycisphaerales bacterium]|nr:MAG: hypothetical protein JSU94_09275 [Phycisphaerales bacterium]